MNFPDILSTTYDTRLPIPLLAFGIGLTLPLQRPDTSLGILHLLLEPRLQLTSMCGANCKIIVSKMPAYDKIEWSDSKCLFYNYANDLNEKQITMLDCKMRRLNNRSIS